MLRRFLLFVLALALPSTAFATWSVIAVDLSTGRVVIASATCVNNNDEFLKGVQAVVVPGKGVAACQAGVDGTHANQMLVFNELQKGTDPARIIELLSADPAFQSRQFGILDLQGRSAGHSGLTNGYVSQDIQGRVPGTQIYYSIQGNILRPGEVVPNAVKAFLDNKGAITDRVMAAMEAADASGGDSRCTCPPPPADGSKPAIPCDGKTAHVAYILMAERERHQRRLAQQRQVHDVHQGRAAGRRQRARARSSRREPESGEDAAHALRRVAQAAAGDVQVGRDDAQHESSVVVATHRPLGGRGRAESSAAANRRQQTTAGQPPAGGQRGGGRAAAAASR